MSSLLIAIGFFAFLFLLGVASKKLPRGARNDTGWIAGDSTDSSTDCSGDSGGCDGGDGGGDGGGD